MPINMKEFEVLPTAVTRGNSYRAQVLAQITADKAFSFAELVMATKLTEKQVKQAVSNLRRDKRVVTRGGYVALMQTPAKK